VRPIELPGLGIRADEALCLGEQYEGSMEEILQRARAQRQQLCSALVDAIEPLTRMPYGLFGFSQGALLAYFLVLEIAHRNLPPPLLFVVTGRGPPSMSTPYETDETRAASMETLRQIMGAKDPEVLELLDAWSFDGTKLSKITPLSEQPRLGRIWRSGQSLSSTPLDGAPMPITSCRVFTIGSDADTMWPPECLQRWADIANAGFDQALVLGLSHFRLMTSADLVTRTVAELAVAAAAKASASNGVQK